LGKEVQVESEKLKVEKLKPSDNYKAKPYKQDPILIRY